MEKLNFVYITVFILIFDAFTSSSVAVITESNVTTRPLNDNNNITSSWNSSNSSSDVIKSKSSYFTGCRSGQTLTSENFMFIVILVCIFVIGVTGNTLAIIVIFVSRRLRKGSTNIFVASLALCDVLVLLFLVPIKLNMYLKNRNFCFNHTVCEMLNVTDLLFHISSITHLWIIAIDRFIAIKWPFVYERIITRRITVVCIAISWLYSTIWASLSSFNWQTPSLRPMYINQSRLKRNCYNENTYLYTAVFSIIYIIPLTVMAGLYICILRIALRQARSIAIPTTHQTNNGGTAKRRKTQEFKAARTLATVYGAFVVCWLPLAIIVLVSYWCGRCLENFKKANRLAYDIVFKLFIDILPLANSCINPFIYFWLNSTFRNTFKMLVCRNLQRTFSFKVNNNNYNLTTARTHHTTANTAYMSVPSSQQASYEMVERKHAQR